MPNYFYTDASGQKQGPVNDQQIKALVTNGTITPNTLLETDGGHRGTAGQMPGLNFNSVTATPHTPRISIMSIKSWLFDFAFADIRLHTFNLWVCRILYVMSWISWIVPGLLVIGAAISDGAFRCETFYSFRILLINIVIYTSIMYIFLTPFIIMFIIMVRLFCEWYIIMFDWIIETTKAARIYIKEKQGE
jgi:hypothetical protein